MLTHWGFGLLPVDILDIDSWFRGKSSDTLVSVSSTLDVRDRGTVVPQEKMKEFNLNTVQECMDQGTRIVTYYNNGTI